MKTMYVLITAARNEEAFIGRTIESVLKQSVLPQKWIIVSDNSVDNTVLVVKAVIKNYDFIKLLSVKDRTGSARERDFGAKVAAFNLALRELSEIRYDYVGILDADVSFDNGYYETLLRRFDQDDKLGLAGGLIYDAINGKHYKWITQIKRSVGGPIQLFRRECFNAMGGFVPLRTGGEDAVAEFMTRMHGWRVETFPEVRVIHHRPLGTAVNTVYKARFLTGIRDYVIGYWFVYEILKSIRQMLVRPYVIGGVLWLLGYVMAPLLGYKRILPHNVTKFIQKEQKALLFFARRKAQPAYLSEYEITNNGKITCSAYVYVVISPVRNEERFIERTIHSVVNQTVLPKQWIIVDDGSTDMTKKIVEKYAQLHPWIILVERKNRGFDKLGAGVVEAFYEGLSHVNVDYDYLVKLDGDLSFEHDYFEYMLKKFECVPGMGMASGQSYVPLNGTLIWEDTPEDHVKGLLCMYKKECFQAIGGLLPSLGWDTVDEIRARMLGWRTRSFKEKRIIHYRPLGSKGGALKGHMRHGYIAYLIGNHPLYVGIRCLYRLSGKPFIIGSCAYLLGYLKGYFKKADKVVTKEEGNFYRQEQLRKLRSSAFFALYFYKIRALFCQKK